MNFSLEGPGAAIGSGIGNAIKALALGGQYRQKAELDAGAKSSQAYHQQMAGNKAGAEAAILAERLGLMRDPTQTAMIEAQVPLANRPNLEKWFQTGSQGPQYDTLPADVAGPVLPAPIPKDKLDFITRAIGLANRTNMTGSKVDDMARASDIEQTIRDRQTIQAGGAALPTAQAYYATSGKAPFDNVSDTGYTIDQINGAITEQNPALAKLFGDKRTSETRENNAQAANAGASAGLTNDKRKYLGEKGALPGTGAEGGEGALSSTILRTLQVPKLDEKGQPVINPMTGAQEMTTDLEALKGFYGWADANKRKPTAAAFSTWEAQGRPAANKSASTAPGASKIHVAPVTRADRKVGTVYQTPKGPMKWTGTGWLPETQ